MSILGVLASGRGSNFEAIQENIINGYLDGIKIGVLITDVRDSGAARLAESYKIPVAFESPETQTKDSYMKYIVETLKKYNVDLVVLAGFMRIIRKPVLKAFPDRVINIHPSLLPAFPGMNAQKQAFDYGVPISGCTVHYVDENMDTGPIIAQSVVSLGKYDTLDDLTAKILKKEHQLYSYVIKVLLSGKIILDGRKVVIMENNIKLPKERK